MSFPKNIAEKVLVDCKRSCAICHKFCGTRIELHHIRPTSEGGEDSYDNCLPLCFDCHADVGAYNLKHPKGRKYSESELKEHKNRWYSKVKESNGFEAVKYVVLPNDVSDPEIRDGITLLLSKTLGRLPTQQEIENVQSRAQVTEGSEHVSYDDLCIIDGGENEQAPYSNNPYYFPKLNETALKKHIDLTVNECPFSEILDRITLYQGVVNHYQLIVEAPKNHTGFSKTQKFWERDAPDLFENHFIEVYHENPRITFRYEEGNFWHDWSCLVTDINKQLPDILVNIKYKWVLYEK